MNPSASFPDALRGGTARVETTAVEDFAFNQQYASYASHGFALDISTNEIIGQKSGKDSSSVSVPATGKSKKRRVETISSTIANEDSFEETDGPWAPWKKVDSNLKNSKTDVHITASTVPSAAAAAAAQQQDSMSSAAAALGINEDHAITATACFADNEPAHANLAVASNGNMFVVEPDEEDEKWEKVNERKQTFTLPPRPPRGSVPVADRSIFHGESLLDYQGRPWNSVPSGLKTDDGDHECFLPKKCIKKLAGHSKGVQAIEFIPGTGHLLLSASMDSKCKLWDTTSDFRVRRTFMGHSEGIRAVHMNNTGSTFLSSGFDRYIRQWDIESGKTISTFTNRKMSYSVKYHPLDDNVFIAACSDNKLYQWDCRSGCVVQEYNHHLKAVNTVTFFDEGRKFISTSDDKKMLIWEFGIPVPIKYIAEPDMHSMPSMTLHPSETAVIGQSMDNRIVAYTCGEKVKLLKKKLFTGHNNSGYACQAGFSPNGKFLMSGDGLGQLHFWDWKTCISYRKFQAHDNGPCIGTAWHPLRPSMVATCGWDGLIKIWN